MSDPRERIRIRLCCRGAVQGVGFRPTAHRLARAHGLAGWVANDPEGATIEVEGPAESVEQFVADLSTGLPQLARLDQLIRQAVEVQDDGAFTVRESEHGQRTGALVPPDAAICDDCRQEMQDRDDRHHHYPFTTCTSCGPRFSLVHELPYDRGRTAMACFPLCTDCEDEYTDPSDRRFHAEPVSCPACGPRLWIVDSNGKEIGSGRAAIELARAALVNGDTVAVKGIGGFQLACRADSETAVRRLRQRKRRPTRPFAVMVRSIDEARRLIRLEERDELLMCSYRSPIVLARRRAGSELADSVAPGLEDVGLLLPTSPLHVELLRDTDLPPLVMTSGNLSEEPICRGNREAVERLSGIADLLLIHDRDIVRRVDDSVVRSTTSGPFLVRRSRGWVPEPLPLPISTTEPVLAVGGHLQTTVCLAVGEQAFVSQHVGDLDSVAARSFHQEAINGLEQFLECEPKIVIADLHPDYPSTWLAQRTVDRRDGRLIAVQHHVAHGAAVLAEHGRFPGPEETALCLCLDGTGWGTDGTAWGGELLTLSGRAEWSRVASLEPLALVGGEQAVKEPWRLCVAALVKAGVKDTLPRLDLARCVDQDLLGAIILLAEQSPPTWPLSSGAGRIFEACAALLGLVSANTWEGEAAARLEALAGMAEAGPWPEAEGLVTIDAELPRLSTSGLLRLAAERAIAGESAAAVAAGFHSTFCHLLAELCLTVVGSWRGVVAIGGGCLINRRLRTGLSERLAKAGLEPLLPERLPPGDGGLAYGQAVVGAVAESRVFSGTHPGQVRRSI